MRKRGSEVTFTNNYEEKVKAKDVRLTLKDGESVKVVICTTEDYYQYPAHNDFNHGIFPQACHEENCPLCAVAALGDEFKALKVRDRYKFAFYVIDQDKIMAFDATAGQAKKLKDQITEDYYEDIEFGAVFTFKRVGNGKDTSYTLSLISERKLTAKDKEAIEKYKGYHIPDEFFEDITEPVMKGYVYKLLEEKAGIDVRAMFPDAAEEMAKLNKDDENATPTTPAGDDNELPFNP